MWTKIKFGFKFYAIEYLLAQNISIDKKNKIRDSD